MKRIFVDMDGTLAVWQPGKQIEDLYQPGYFAALEPQMSVVEAVKELIQNHSDEVEVFILSAVFPDCPTAVCDKKKWLQQYLPEIDRSHRIFSSVRKPKYLAVPGGIRQDDVLLDDYTVNLLAWANSAVGVKLLNGINHSRGTWKGTKVHKNDGAEAIVKAILEAKNDGFENC